MCHLYISRVIISFTTICKVHINAFWPHSKSSQSSKPWRTSEADVVPLISPKFLKLFVTTCGLLLLLKETACIAAGESALKDDAEVAVVLESCRDTITEPKVCLFLFKSWGAFIVAMPCYEFAVSLVR